MQDRVIEPGEFEAVWGHISSCAGTWRIPVLASQSDSGADARMVVLRDADSAAHSLRFYTDRRSHKHSQMEAEPDVCLVFWSPEEKLQVRAYGRTQEVRDRELLDELWKQMPPEQKALYLLDVSDGHEEEGRENFTAFDVELSVLRCLWLREGGNLATRFDRHGDEWQAHAERP
ncbi:MAG: pyridoxamine 5'-phosphate oxidase family protein [Gammaproteobacteria bacterium]|nr:pyridoxamine 5'-phosphate oxidase family protein [Gammaproteobacteria bacterium]